MKLTELIKNMTLTEILAIWGAGLSTVLAVFKILEYRRDRADIKVTVQDLRNDPIDKRYLIISAVNKGRRVVTLEQAGFLMPRNVRDVINRYLKCTSQIGPRELTEGEHCDYNILLDSARARPLFREGYVAYVIDATGKHYYSHNWLSRLLKLGRIK